MQNWAAKVIFLTIIISAAAIVVTKFSPPIPISSVVTQKMDLFTVSGEGKVTVVPDTAIVTLGITSTQSTVKLAQNKANEVIKKVTDDLKLLGVDSQDIQTDNYSIYPQYDYNTQPAKINGYNVTASLTVTVKDFDRINEVIDKATSDGANTVSGVRLTVDDDKEKILLQEAREKAVKEAKAKAESLSRAAGLTLGRIVNVQEAGAVGSPAPMLFAADAVGRGGAMEKTSIQAGSTDITSSVVLTYETR